MGARLSRSNDETRVRSLVQGLTATLTLAQRTPIQRTPAEHGLRAEEVIFGSLDGVRLEGWWIPGSSERLVICTHPLHGTRYGLPAHLKDWAHLGGRELSFMPLYKALHAAGFGVLCFDLRNHGKSGGDDDGNQRFGLHEYRDVVGALRYVRERSDTRRMKVALLGAGLGANASLIACAREGAEHGVRALIALQPSSTRPLLERVATRTELSERFELVEEAIEEQTSYALDALSPLACLHALRVPTLHVQLRSACPLQSADAKVLHEGLASRQKKLLWLDGAGRLDGYAHCAEQPGPLLAWLRSQIPSDLRADMAREAASAV